MSWENEELDHLFKSNSEKISFEYKDAYWKEIESLLPKKKKRDFFWFFTASSFAGLLLMGMFYAPIQKNQLTKTNDEKQKLAIVSYQLEKIQEERKLHSNTHLVSTHGDSHTIHLGKENQSFDFSDKQIKLKSKLRFGEIRSKSTRDVGSSTIAKNLQKNNQIQTEQPTQKNLIPQNSIENTKEFFQEEQINDLNELILLPINPIQRQQNSDIILIQPIEKEIPLQSKIYVEVVAGITQSLVTPSDRVGGSYGLGLGIQLTKKRWNFNLGVNGLIGNFNDVHLTRIAKKYGFGSTEIRHELNYSKLFSLEGNFSVGYMLGRHEVSLGIRPSYVLSTKVNYSRNSEGTNLDNKSYVGHMEGVNRFGLKPTLGYTYHFKKGWQLGIRGGVQLFESFDSDYIQKENAKLPIDGQLFLRKTFNFRKK